MGAWLSECLKGVLPNQYEEIDDFPLDDSLSAESPRIMVKSPEKESLLRAGPQASDSIEVPGSKAGGPSSSQRAKFSAPNTFFVNYDLKEIIGYGSTSEVHRCLRKSDGKEFACKLVDKGQMEKKFSGLLDQFYVEIKVLQMLRHPHIVHLEDVYDYPDRIIMVMELMQGGEIFDYVVDKGTLSEEEASVLVRSLTSAVSHMHDMNVIHRDLKPENLLLTNRNGGSNSQVKLIDFGLAKIVSDSTPASSFLGTRGYLAPEMLQRHTYDKAVDIWALGVIVFVLLCGCLPFDDDSSRIATDDDARRKFTLRFPRWAMNLSAPAKDLLQCLLDVNPRTRYTAQQALNHPWVTGRTVAANNMLPSPSMIGERRKELRSPVTPGTLAMKKRMMEQNNSSTKSPAGPSATERRPRKNSL